jgi:DNA-binding MarR family transcriptional regulator
MYGVMYKIDQLYQLIWMSRPLMQAAEACVEKGLNGTGLTVRMRAVLEILHAYGDATVPDIAQRLHIKRQYVQLMVTETLTEQLTIARPNPRHKTSPMIALTDHGRSVIAQVVAREKQLVESIETDFSVAEVATALDIVMALTAKLKDQAGGSS